MKKLLFILLLSLLSLPGFSQALLPSQAVPVQNAFYYDPVGGRLFIYKNKATGYTEIAVNDNIRHFIDSCLFSKVDKVPGKGLSSKDFTYADSVKLSHQSGTNTGDQDISAMAHANRVFLDLVSGTNTGDETTQTIKTKLSITTLTGSNTGDQDITAMTHTNRAALDVVSGTNTGDETGATIKTKLGITTLSGSNTGDQDISAMTHANRAALDVVSGTNTGDETGASIKTKLGITTLSGSNTGDQDISAMTHANRAALDLVSGTNTGDETGASIKTKLGITTLSGVNTGDQDLSRKADLDGNGKLFTSQLPSIAITQTYLVASESAMLALPANVGDVAVRTDLYKSFILANSPATTLSNWQVLLSPVDAVLSVNGQTGTVSLTTAVIDDSNNKRYVTEAEKLKLANTSGVNTGDETAATIKTKLGITTLSGSNTGDQDITAMTHTNRAALDVVSGTNTGDETAATIKTKLGITTLSGSNTGDQDISAMNHANRAALDLVSGTNTGDQDISAMTHTNRTELDVVSGTNTGDETAATIKSKLGITTLSGSNTGDETTATIKTKLGITTLSGSNTGDQDITAMTHANRAALDLVSGTNTGDQDISAMTHANRAALDLVSGTNTGDETAATIKSKLGITTLSGSNTGDQTITLTGDVSGTGTSGITTTIGANKVTNSMLAGSIDYSKMNSSTVPTWNQNTTGTASYANNSTQLGGQSNSEFLAYRNLLKSDVDADAIFDNRREIYNLQTGNGSGNTHFPNNSAYGTLTVLGAGSFCTQLYSSTDNDLWFRTRYISGSINQWNRLISSTLDNPLALNKLMRWNGVNAVNSLISDDGSSVNISTPVSANSIAIRFNNTYSGGYGEQSLGLFTYDSNNDYGSYITAYANYGASLGTGLIFKTRTNNGDLHNSLTIDYDGRTILRPKGTTETLKMIQNNDPGAFFLWKIDDAVDGTLSLYGNEYGTERIGFSQTRNGRIRIGYTSDPRSSTDALAVNGDSYYNGNGHFEKNLTALNFTGSSTGTNTGDQDISAMAHANRAALDLVSGTNTGDQDLSVKADKNEINTLTVKNITNYDTPLFAINLPEMGDMASGLIHWSVNYKDVTAKRQTAAGTVTYACIRNYNTGVITCEIDQPYTGNFTSGSFMPTFTFTPGDVDVVVSFGMNSTGGEGGDSGKLYYTVQNGAETPITKY